MITLLWIIAFMSTKGIESGPMNEYTKFATPKECYEFGEKMKPRVMDYIRGAKGLEWNHPIQVAFQCQLEGTDV